MDKFYHKLLLSIIKYMPIIQMIGILLNNTMYYFNILNKYVYILDYVLGNSIITTILLYVCSYVFKFCNWYRLIITSNLIVISTNIYDVIFRIPINNLELLILFYVIYFIFLLIIIINKFKCHEKKSNQATSKRT